MKLDLTLPRDLDVAIGGVYIYINQRPDGAIYWSRHDFSRFGVNPLLVMRVKKRRDWLAVRHAISGFRRARDQRS